MMTMRGFSVLAFCCVLLAVLSPVAVLHAAGGADPEWPCIQRKVPEITAGVVWTGPQFSDKDRSWQKVPAVADMVTRLSQRRLALDDAKRLIDDFATGLGAQKNLQLTSLFAGLLQTINRERREIMAGIGRYAKKQLALAEKINTTRHEFNAVLSKAELSAEDEKRRDALEEQLSWDTRIFDERQQSLTYVCESPVLLEQRLFALGRQILQHVE
ncbi:MAG: hypothetical protein ACR2PM_07480 [Hyphomicrobiales bacterium]